MVVFHADMRRLPLEAFPELPGAEFPGAECPSHFPIPVSGVPSVSCLPEKPVDGNSWQFLKELRRALQQKGAVFRLVSLFQDREEVYHLERSNVNGAEKDPPFPFEDRLFG